MENSKYPEFTHSKITPKANINECPQENEKRRLDRETKAPWPFQPGLAGDCG